MNTKQVLLTGFFVLSGLGLFFVTEMSPDEAEAESVVLRPTKPSVSLESAKEKNLSVAAAVVPETDDFQHNENDCEHSMRMGEELRGDELARLSPMAIRQQALGSEIDEIAQRSSATLIDLDGETISKIEFEDMKAEEERLGLSAGTLVIFTGESHQ